MKIAFEIYLPLTYHSNRLYLQCTMGHNVSILQSYVATKRCRLLVVALQGKVLGSCIDRICILRKLSNQLILKNITLQFDSKMLGEVKRKYVILDFFFSLSNFTTYILQKFEINH